MIRTARDIDTALRIGGDGHVFIARVAWAVVSGRPEQFAVAAVFEDDEIDRVDVSALDDGSIGVPDGSLWRGAMRPQAFFHPSSVRSETFVEHEPPRMDQAPAGRHRGM